ncbi:hypothetical protein TrVE_jg7208 [Triparma verrucosa]|uniref:Uncharacterized protein n=1 Tax=Triparma verrucosa TaxID=1606542 RepID=A0A9W7C1F8_9STRA|nr:hypothetical protein TrVE_jg7208 [Triparma verrucosa]
MSSDSEGANADSLARWAGVKEKRVSQLETMKVDELKCLCRDSGLKVSGKKAELVGRCGNELENKYRVTLNRFVSSEEKRMAIEGLKRMLEFMDKIKSNQMAAAINGSEPNRQHYGGGYGGYGGSGGQQSNGQALQVSALGRGNAHTAQPYKQAAPRPRPHGSAASSGSTTSSSSSSWQSPSPTTSLSDLKFSSYRGFTFRLNKYPLVTCTISAPSNTRPSSNTTNTTSDLYDVSKRLCRWDPFNVPYATNAGAVVGQIFSHTVTIAGSTFRVQPSTQQPSRPPTSLAILKFEVPPAIRNQADVVSKKIVWLVRCLPCKAQQGKADTHLWPKNTSLFVNGAEVTNIRQRRQQSHDMSLWKGMSHPLNITGMVRATSGNTLTLLHNDPEKYVVVLTPVLEKSPAAVTESLGRSMEKVGVEKGKEEARRFIRESSVVLLDSDEEEEEEEEEARTYSLHDPVAKVLISNPVTGKRCTHVQCFDLGFYLSLNAYPSARRWRCPCCEKFTSHEDLRRSELFGEWLKEYNKDAKGNETREVSMVEFKAKGGEWELAKPKVATSKKRKSQTQGGVIEGEEEEKRMEKRLSMSPPPPPSNKPQQEIIEIDMD